MKRKRFNEEQIIGESIGSIGDVVELVELLCLAILSTP